MSKKPRKKIKCLENGKSFSGEMKNIFHHFERPFIEANNTFFWKVSVGFKIKLPKLSVFLR